ncbi:putative tetratricopeptide-like helical domain superfamily [Helianthus debilis subsp. tardiflorus]
MELVNRGYVNHGILESIWAVLMRMKHCGFCFDEYTFGSILKGVGSNECLFAKCGRVVDARKCFDCMPERNTVSCNALISGYVEMGDRFNCLLLFKSMHREGVRLDDGTFSPHLTAFDNPDLCKQTTQVHCAIIKHGMLSDCSVLNATISAYSGCGSVKDAKKVFDGASGERVTVSWNVMLAACLEHDKWALAFNLFRSYSIIYPRKLVLILLRSFVY